MKKSKKLFEPITDPQIEKIFTLIREIDLSEEALYSKVTKLIGFPSVSSLSKQEASWLIDSLQGSTKWSTPLSARYEDEIPGDTSSLPFLSHIIGIRKIVKALGWEKGHFKAWLKKYRKVPNIRSLNRERAKDTFLALRKIQEWEKKHPKKGESHDKQ